MGQSSIHVPTRVRRHVMEARVEGLSHRRTSLLSSLDLSVIYTLTITRWLLALPYSAWIQHYCISLNAAELL